MRTERGENDTLWRVGRHSLTFVAAAVAVGFAMAQPACADLAVVGASPVAADNIRLVTALDELPCDAPPWLVRVRFEQLDDDIRRALAGLGYYQATWQTQLDFEQGCWHASVAVQQGMPVLLRHFAFELAGDGSADANLAALTQADGFASGTALDHERYRALKRSINAFAAERGYFDGEFSHAAIDVYVDDNVADIDLRYDAGRRYVFGDLIIEQDLVDADLIYRYAAWEPGAAYSATRLATLNQRLQSSGYFTEVVVEPTIPDTYGPVDVVARLSGDPAPTYLIGAGYSSDIGPRFSAGYENRRVNRRGHQLHGDLSVAPVRSELSATYRRPLRDPSIEWLSYTLGAQAEDTDTADSESVAVAVQRVRRLGAGWLRTDSLTLEVSDFTVGSVDDSATLLMPALAFSRERSDDPIYPRRGGRLVLSARGAAEALGSSSEFLQLRADARWIRALTRRIRLLSRASLATTYAPDLEELPPSVRLFAGGNESVRGFGFETLGPRDADGVVVGGAHLAVASIELDYELPRGFAVALFADGGNAFDGTTVDARLAAGLGIKWRSPVGPLRFYVARPLNFDERDLRVHISLGPEL